MPGTEVSLTRLTRLLRPHDRNASTIARNDVQSGVAPHSVTERWSYTVPAGKLAMLAQMQVLASRQTAATTPGTIRCSIRVTPSGGSVTRLLSTVITGNTAGQVTTASVGSCGILMAGDSISGATEDSSTGGTAYYESTALIMEFDA